MKTNIHGMFSTDKSLEDNGVWFDFGNDIKFLVARFGARNTKLKKVMAKFYKPFAKQIESGTLSMDKEKEIMTHVFVHSCLLNWEGIKDESSGSEIPFSLDAGVELLISLPELSDTLFKYAQDSDNYKEALGNS